MPVIDHPVPALLVRELGGEQREIVLSGRALPYSDPGLQLEGTMRAEVRWYPGNPVGTVQVLGVEEGETTLRGMWKKRFLQEADVNGGTVYATLDHDPLGDVEDLVALFDDVRRQGQLLHVEWNHIAREGILRRFSQRWVRVRDCEWEATFVWISQAETPGDPVFVSQPNLAEMQQGWRAALEKLKAAVKALLAPVQAATRAIQSVANAVNDAVNTVATLVQAIADTVAAVVSAVLDVVDAVRRVVAILQSIKATFRNLVTTLQARFARTMLALSDTLGIGAATPAQTIAAERNRRGVLDLVRTLLKQALEQETALLKKLGPTLLGTAVAKQDEDLRDVSTRFYGTPDEWRRLAAYNSLSSSRLTAGVLIFVPPLRSATGTC